MAIIKKKIWPRFYEDIASGRKKYDWRLNDFEVNEGDTIVFEEWDPDIKEYTGRTLEKKIVYIGRFDLKNTFFSPEELLEKGILIMSLE